MGSNSSWSNSDGVFEMGLSGVDTSFSRLKDSSHLHALSKQH